MTYFCYHLSLKGMMQKKINTSFLVIWNSERFFSVNGRLLRAYPCFIPSRTQEETPRSLSKALGVTSLDFLNLKEWGSRKRWMILSWDHLLESEKQNPITNAAKDYFFP